MISFGGGGGGARTQGRMIRTTNNKIWIQKQQKHNRNDRINMNCLCSSRRCTMNTAGSLHQVTGTFTSEYQAIHIIIGPTSLPGCPYTFIHPASTMKLEQAPRLWNYTSGLLV